MKYLFLMCLCFFQCQSAYADVITVSEDDLTVDQSFVVAQTIIQSRRVFGSRRAADDYCYSTFHRQGLASFCHVRQERRGWSSNFRVTVRGEGRTFDGAFNAVRNFLNRNRLFFEGIRLAVDFFRNRNDMPQ